ncbi:PREDICTED: proline-rich protein HaeIII subfamily 1-like [Ceratotherium simum simum]|uniref:Proline-rich protein HaeIII subfamily 1-like n=1 Tax=Ceratotherium simum simum TaxID=73337 RepID=A0ABM1D3Q9_CERSS|nr:PREDICTED: proline-rich protein HaeIII subfamily 1-like [Ceratotherium simum simum]
MTHGSQSPPAFPTPGPPGARRSAVAAAPDQQRPNNDGRGRESSPTRRAPALGLRGHPAPRGSRRSPHRWPSSPGTRFFLPPNVETARARPRSPEHPAPGGPQSRSSRRGSDSVSPETRQRTGREGASGRGTGENSRSSYGAQFLPERSCSRAPAPAPVPRAGPPALPRPAEGPPGTLPQPTHALSPKTLGTPEATAIRSRSDPQRCEAEPGRCAPRRSLPLPEAATPTAHPARRPLAGSRRVLPQGRLPSRS